MERQGWQSRARACSARTVSTVSKPFKKPRQAKERLRSPDTESEAPTQLPPQSDNEGTPDLNPKTTKNTEYVPSPASLWTVSETDDEEDNVPISQTLGKEIRQSDVWVPSTKTKALLAEADKKAKGELDQALLAGEQAIPEGQEAIGVGIARDFGKDVGVFRGEVKHVKAKRKRHIYHVHYEDGDSEYFDLEEYQFAFEVRKALDAGMFRRNDCEGQNDDRISCDGTDNEWNETENGSESDDNTTLRKKNDHTQRRLTKVRGKGAGGKLRN
jgi:hypothetical protein